MDSNNPIYAALRKFKLRYFGERPWSGAGAPGVGGVSDPPIEDVSFHIERGPEAVLLIHGLTGTPTEMRFVGKMLAAKGFTVHCVQLAGHCGTEAQLLQTNWHDWYNSVEQAYDELTPRYEKVYVAGLSMGAVLALRLAANRPVPRIALYSTTLWYDGWSIPRLQFLLPLILRTPLADKFRFVELFPYGIKDTRLRNVVVAGMMAGDSAAAGTLGMSGRSLRDMHALIRDVKALMPKITTPTLILHATEDDLTSVRNADYVAAHLAGPVRKVLLDDCYHMITVDRQRAQVVEETVQFFNDETVPEATVMAAE